MSVPRFWREIPQRYNLQAAKCGACEGVYFPPREVCPACRRASIGKMAPMRLSGVGTIVEWTRVHKPAPGYEMQVPYTVALIQAPEGPLLTGQVVDSASEAIHVGAHVRSVFRRVGQDGEAGVIHYGTKWVVEARGAEARSDAVPTGKATDGKRRKGRNKALFQPPVRSP